MDIIKLSGDRKEWLAMRRSGVGGSDVAAILGLSPWRSPVDVWLDKTGQTTDQEPNESMYWGTILEDIVAREYQERTGRKVRRVNSIIKHPSLPLLANIDRAVHDSGTMPVVNGEFRTDTILECKTAGPYAANEWGEPDTDEIPQHYLCQCIHYLGITGVQFCDVAVLIGGREFKKYRICRDEELIAAIQEECAKFWRDFVVANTPPPPRTAEETIKLFPKSNEIKKVSTTDIEKAVLAYRELQEEVKAKEEELSRLKDSICSYLCVADTLVDVTGKTLLTWKSSKSSQAVNYEAIANELFQTVGSDKAQELTKKFTFYKPGSRRFTIKKQKEDAE